MSVFSYNSMQPQSYLHKFLCPFTHSVVIGVQLGVDAKSSNNNQNDNQDVELERKRGAQQLLKWLLKQSEVVRGW